VPLTLDATVGGANANSFASRIQADAYFLTRPFADAWTAASSTQQDQALVFATTLLNGLRWAGGKGATNASALTQALAWPRQWAPTLEADAQPEFVTEYFVDTTLGYFSSLAVPSPIVQATCELALEILKSGTTDLFGQDTTRNIKSETVDVISTTYFDPQYRVYWLARFPAVMNLIAPLLRGGVNEIERV
jgi:hypothetical protein